MMVLAVCRMWLYYNILTVVLYGYQENWVFVSITIRQYMMYAYADSWVKYVQKVMIYITNTSYREVALSK